MVISLLWSVLPLLLSSASADTGPARAPNFWDPWSLPRVWLAVALAVIGLGLLMSGRVKKQIRLVVMGLAFLLWGVVPALPLGDFALGMGLHPSPICLIGRPLQFLSLGRGVPVMFLSLIVFVAILSLIGSKLFCGWTCPIGALQEMAHAIPLPKRRRIRIPFGPSNTVRFAVFAGFIAVLFGFRIYLYDYFNPFHFLHWDFTVISILVIAVVMAAALLIYRPFCYILCPVGLLTWPLEQVALTRIQFKKSRCTDCMRCVRESPCPAVEPILRQQRIRPDCHACGECVRICPEGALSFKHSFD